MCSDRGFEALTSERAALSAAGLIGRCIQGFQGHKKFTQRGLPVTPASHLATTLRAVRVLDSIQDFDRRILLILQQSQSWLARHSRGFSRTADGYCYVLIGALIALLPIDGERFLWHGALAFSLERGTYRILKNSLKRRRPPQALPDFKSHIIAADEFSFPSGHASAAFLFVTLLVLHYGPLYLPLYLWSMGVAMSRVYLGVHFPTDTVMGAALGTGIALSTAYWLL